MKSYLRTSSLCLTLLLPALASAQNEPRPPRNSGAPGDMQAERREPRNGGGPINEIFDNLFPPDFVEMNQAALSLSPDQKKQIMEAILNSQRLLLENRWSGAAAKDSFVKALKNTSSDEKTLVEAHEKLLESDALMKRVNMNLLLRIRAILTPAQKAILARIKKELQAGGEQMRPGPRPGQGE
jgi:Spy/CpxP family protein refolding chaperone